MNWLIELGWNGIGIIAGLFFLYLAFAMAFGALRAIFDPLSRWVERNGWNR